MTQRIALRMFTAQSYSQRTLSGISYPILQASIDTIQKRPIRISTKVKKPTRNCYFVEKTAYMKVADLQLQLHQIIDTISDSKKLEAVYTLLKGENGPFKPMSMDEYVGAIDESRQQIIDGEYLEVDELEKESDDW